MRVCIYAASSSRLDEAYFAAADKMAEALAKACHGMVFGGGKEGLMGAAARAMRRCGGEIIGIAPRFFDEPGVLFEDCNELVFTETMRERKALMQERSDAFLVLPGGIGTLEEFFETLTLKQLGQEDRAIVLLNTEGFFDSLDRLLHELVERGFMSKNCLDIYYLASSPEDVLDYLRGYVRQTGSIKRLSDYNK